MRPCTCPRKTETTGLSPASRRATAGLQRALEKNDDREHEHGHGEHQPFHVVVFEPTREMQDDDGNRNHVKQGKQNIRQRTVPLPFGDLAAAFRNPGVLVAAGVVRFARQY